MGRHNLGTSHCCTAQAGDATVTVRRELSRAHHSAVLFIGATPLCLKPIEGFTLPAPWARLDRTVDLAYIPPSHSRIGTRSARLPVRSAPVRPRHRIRPGTHRPPHLARPPRRDPDHPRTAPYEPCPGADTSRDDKGSPLGRPGWLGAGSRGAPSRRIVRIHPPTPQGTPHRVARAPRAIPGAHALRALGGQSS